MGQRNQRFLVLLDSLRFRPRTRLAFRVQVQLSGVSVGSHSAGVEAIRSRAIPSPSPPLKHSYLAISHTYYTGARQGFSDLIALNRRKAPYYADGFYEPTWTLIRSRLKQ